MQKQNWSSLERGIVILRVAQQPNVVLDPLLWSHEHRSMLVGLHAHPQVACSHQVLSNLAGDYKLDMHLQLNDLEVELGETKVSNQSKPAL